MSSSVPEREAEVVDGRADVGGLDADQQARRRRAASPTARAGSPPAAEAPRAARRRGTCACRSPGSAPRRRGERASAGGAPSRTAADTAATVACDPPAVDTPAVPARAFEMPAATSRTSTPRTWARCRTTWSRPARRACGPRRVPGRSRRSDFFSGSEALPRGGGAADRRRRRGHRDRAGRQLRRRAGDPQPAGAAAAGAIVVRQATSRPTSTPGGRTPPRAGRRS